MDEFLDFVNGLYANNTIEIVAVNFNQPNAEVNTPKLQQKKFKQSFVEKIVKVDGAKFEWFDPNNPDILGKTKILPTDKIINAYVIDKDDIAFDEEEEGHLLDFRIVDQVQEEWCVGIFCGDNATDSLYFYDWKSTVYYLGLNMEGYIKMLIATRGFNLWQKALIQHRTGEVTTTALANMKEHLPRLFPEVKLDEVFALYDSLFFREETMPGAE